MTAYDLSTQAGRSWASGQVTQRAYCVLAGNPGVMTLDGTNTWVLREPGASECVVIDPGPLDEGHLDRVMVAATRDGGRVGLTLLTHDHADHAAAATRFAQLSGAPVRQLGRAHADLADGDCVVVGGLELLVVTTPGHTSDSLSFLMTAENVLLTGDTVLGRGTTVVAWPDGRLEEYLHSLDRIARLTGAGTVTRILPGHGPELADAAAVLKFYIEHRAERLDQVRAAVAAGARTPREVVELAYTDAPQANWGAAELSVRAQLDYLHASLPGSG